MIDTIEITCTKNGQKKTADVMQHDDKYIKCVVEGTQIAIELFRDDVNVGPTTACGDHDRRQEPFQGRHHRH